VIPSSAPTDKKTTDLIANLRKSSVQKEVTGSTTISLAVTGSTALQEDISNKLAAVLPQYLAIVVGLSLVLLVVAFRSVVVPVKATLGFLLSVLAMFGALVAVFQWGWFGLADAPGPIVSFIPIIAIGILFGLAMDYEFFLVSGMHESYQHSKDARQAVVNGFGAGSKVVTAAGIIMISVFAGFVSNHDATIQAMGFGLAIGILVDAFIVRMTIVPAVMVLLGNAAWWLPKWLGKLLPHISIEGEADKN
jgi:RND superfamily putative drug exporter